MEPDTWGANSFEKISHLFAHARSSMCNPMLDLSDRQSGHQSGLLEDSFSGSGKKGGNTKKRLGNCFISHTGMPFCVLPSVFCINNPIQFHPLLISRFTPFTRTHCVLYDVKHQFSHASSLIWSETCKYVTLIYISTKTSFFSADIIFLRHRVLYERP